jgi:hypothetical protein
MVHAPDAAQRSRPRLAFGRSLGDFRIQSTGSGLLPAEEKLLEAVARGQRCQLSDPTMKLEQENLEAFKADVSRHMRANFLAFLALGGDEHAPVHQKGISLEGAYISGPLDLAGGEIPQPLIFSSCYFDDAIFLQDALTQAISLAHCRIHDDFIAIRARIKGGLFLQDGFVAEKAVLLPDAKIDGPLICRGGRFSHALTCDNIKIAGNVVLNDGFSAYGTVSFDGAAIDGNIDCRTSYFREVSGVALLCRHAQISGSLFLIRGSAEGEVSLQGCKISGFVDCSAGMFKNGGAVAIDAEKSIVDGGIFLANGFLSEGTVSIRAAEVGGDLDCSGGTFANPGAVALDLHGARVQGALLMRNGFSADGTVDLSLANLGSLGDDDVALGRGRASTLVLDGLTYERLSGSAPVDARTRMRWLRRQPREHLHREFRQQPFEQLAKVLKMMGRDTDARRISLFKERYLVSARVRRAPFIGKPLIWLMWRLYGVTMGFGYSPHRLLFLLAGLWLIGAWIYSQAADQGTFAPADSQVWMSDKFGACHPPDGNWTRCSGADELPKFDPIIYSAEVLLPVINLGQRRYWEPMHRKFSLKLPFGLILVVPEWLPPWLVSLQNVLGSFVALLFGGLVAGLLKRD